MINWLILLSTTQATIDLTNCGHDADTQALAQAIINHPKQKRPQLNCHAELTKLAHKRAESLATNISAKDVSPNEFLAKNGFRFPDYYPIHGNQVEAVAKGKNPLDYLIQSDKHKSHVLGIGEFFSLQNEIGVGIYRNSDPAIPDQWVILISEKWKAPKISFKPAPIKPMKAKNVCSGNWENSADRSLKRKCKKLAEEANLQ